VSKNTVKKGGQSAKRDVKPSAPKLSTVLEAEDQKEKPVAYISRKGADGAFVVPAGPIYNAGGVQIGWDPGVHLDFRGVGVTGPLYPESKAEDRKMVERVDRIIEEGWQIVEDLGLERLAPEAPRPPFAKWSSTSASALKVTLSVLFDEDDHDKNVELVKQAARFEKATEDRADVLAMLDGLLASEAGQSDEYEVEVRLS
jgi:hypothetical protein